MKTLAILINIFFPGFGTFFIGRPGAAILQIALSVTGVIFTLTAIGAIIGIPMCIAAWIWALVTVTNSNQVSAQAIHCSELVLEMSLCDLDITRCRRVVLAALAYRVRSVDQKPPVR